MAELTTVRKEVNEMRAIGSDLRDARAIFPACSRWCRLCWTSGDPAARGAPYHEDSRMLISLALPQFDDYRRCT